MATRDRESPSNLVKSHEVIGTSVKNLQGKDLGEVEEIMLNKHDGTVAYVVLSFGGFLGLGDKLFAMPWEIFTFDPSQECFVIDISEERLKGMEGFDQDHWPDMSNLRWRQNIDAYFGIHH